MSGGKALQAAIEAIDALIKKLESGALAAPAGTAAPAAKPAAAPQPVPAAKPEAPQPKKEKKEKKAAAAKQPVAAKAPAAAAPAAGGALTPEEEVFAKAHLAVGRVASVAPHPNSDKLYICKIDVGDSRERQVVAGLQQYITIDELQGSLVAVVLNLKAAKLAGEASEAMILAGSVKGGETELVRVLRPPEGAAPGDRVYLEGGAPSADYQKTLKGWSKIVEALAVKGGRPCYGGRPLVTAAGAVAVSADLPDGAEIH